MYWKLQRFLRFKKRIWAVFDLLWVRFTLRKNFLMLFSNKKSKTSKEISEVRWRGTEISAATCWQLCHAFPH